MDEAAADFKGILARALENGDGYDVEQNGEVVLFIRPPLPEAKHLTFGQLMRELNERAPVDDTFADDLQAAIDVQQMIIPEDPWEKYGADSGHQLSDRSRAGTHGGEAAKD